MATVYYWPMEPQKGIVGHISLGLDDGTYISHWPKERSFSFVKDARQVLTLEDDIEAEGSDPVILQLPKEMIDTEKIKELWSSYNEKGSKYHLFTENCALIVEWVLNKGGLVSKPITEYDYRVTPYKVWKWITFCKRQHETTSTSGKFFNFIKHHYLNL